MRKGDLEERMERGKKRGELWDGERQRKFVNS